MAEGDGTNGAPAAKAGAAPETKDAQPAAEAKDAPAPAVDEADVLEEDDDFEEFEEDRTFSSSCACGFETAARRLRRARHGRVGIVGARPCDRCHGGAHFYASTSSASCIAG